MPANSEWRHDAEDDTVLDEEALQEVEDAIRALSSTLEKYSSPAWVEVFAELEAEQRQAFKVMMSTDDEKLLLTAREKARILASIIDRRDKAERELADLSHQRLILAGEIEEEE